MDQLTPELLDELAEILANDDGTSWRDECPEQWGWNDDIAVDNEMSDAA